VWNFGDGSGASGAVASHTFGNAQTYIVTLTVTNSSGRTHTSAKTVPVGAGTLPTAAFTVSPPAPTARVHDVTYDASTSTAGIGHRIVEYRWQFGDNYPVGCTSPSPIYCYMTPNPVVMHRYDAPGTFITTLTVVDEAGQTRSASVSVTVAP
jgi:PKD repeat protein